MAPPAVPSRRPVRSCAPTSFFKPDDLVLDESDDENDVYYATKAEEKAAKRITRLAKIGHVAAQEKNLQNIRFPLMSLPAEVRIMIYDFALVEQAQDMSIVALQHERVGRGVVHWTKWHYETVAPKRKDEHTRLTPALLVASRQVSAEALPRLYRQPLHFETPAALDLFLNHIGKANRKLLKKVVLRAWDTRHKWVLQTFEAFSLLSTAPNLEEILLEKIRGDGSRNGALDAWSLEHDAKALSKAMRIWVQIVDHLKDKEGASKEILKISDEMFGNPNYEDEVVNKIKPRRKIFMAALEF